ncbi:hypothetical protein LWI29_011700 [Acer saccharum]|uniref:Uncharacterized protein n=1 Tax=Acer saccharum TaxID=4024 RepID=A0AA39VKK0_ACESA|nr:hypothetical protein LWI29_011700 [Acer saccharum]
MMKLKPSSSIELVDDYQYKELLIDIDDNLEPAPECCIYRVPKDLRKINEEAYTPQLISIGPLHHGKEELLDMEKQKLRYMKKLGERITMEKLLEFKTFIKNHEQLIRNCYAETSKLDSYKFVAMILYDAVFIIEFLLRNYDKDKGDFLLNKPGLKHSIMVDLHLLENQVPYFVLQELYRSAFASLNPDAERYPPLFFLSCHLFSDLTFNGMPREAEVKHFTDLIRYAEVESYSKSKLNGYIKDLPCAVKLQESGVKFKCIQGKCLLDVRFEKRKRRLPCFEVDELQMPRFEVYDETEGVIRNLMALEQCHYPLETHICNYVDLLVFLINTEKDVDLLIEAGIISNCVGDNAAIAKMFNKLCQKITLSASCYYDIGEGLKAHYHSPWNHAKATLKSVYFSNLWRGTASVAAVLLLLLTFVQTICSIQQVFFV